MQVTEFRMKLSDRMQVIANHVAAGDVVADVGTDHGQIPVWLFAHGICPKVILSDVSAGSLAKAKETAGAYQFGEGLDFRVGDGLSVLKPAEADTVIIAGMGGKLIRQILAADPVHTASFRTFILQPRKGSGPLRQWLLTNGYRIVCEDVVWESHFLPEIITAVSPGRVAGADLAGALGEKRRERAGSVAGAAKAESAKSGEVNDLAAGYRETLLKLPEDDIRLRVPPWMIRAQGPLEDYFNLRIDQEQLILENMRRAKERDAQAERTVENNIAYLEKLLQNGCTPC